MLTPPAERQPGDPASWNDGWLPAVRHVPSPNFGPRPPDAVIDLVVVHSISLPPGIYGGGQVEALFTNRLDWDAHPYFQTIRGAEVSAHFLIDRRGRITQFVSVADRAWHAGPSSWQGRSNCNDYSVGVELEGLEDESFEPAQYESLAWLITQLDRLASLRAVVGHEHVAPGRKRDPGRQFDWQRLNTRLDRRDLCIGGTAIPACSGSTAPPAAGSETAGPRAARKPR